MVNEEWKNILEDSESNIVLHIQELLKKKLEELRKYI
jgi:ribosomal protein L10